MNVTATFVGGPADGRRQAMPDLRRHYEVASLRPGAIWSHARWQVDTAGDVTPAPMPILRHTYEAVEAHVVYRLAYTREH